MSAFGPFIWKTLTSGTTTTVLFYKTRKAWVEKGKIYLLAFGKEAGRWTFIIRSKDFNENAAKNLKHLFNHNNVDDLQQLDEEEA